MIRKVLEYFINLCYNLIDRIGSGNMSKKYSALDIAKYLICKFNKEDRIITQLKLQKLLYFIEAYYMAAYDELSLYTEDFYAWMYGPVISEVYKKYKIFMSDPIIEEDCNNLVKLSDEVIDSIETVCATFGNFSAHDLIKITHRQGSPWFHTEIKKKIIKVETKKWFNELFLSGVKKHEG